MATSAPKKINLGMTPGVSLIEEAKKTMGSWGKTDLYSTGDPIIDEYLGNSRSGGYGRHGGYEIVTIYGSTGCVSGEAELPFGSNYVKSHKKIKLKNLYMRFHGIPYAGWHGGHDDETIYVRAYSDCGLPKWTKVLDVLDQGTKPTFKVTAGDRTIETTGDHRFLTIDGWKEAQKLVPGDKLVVPSSSSLPHGGKTWIRSHQVYTKFHPRNRKVTVEQKYEYHLGSEHRLAFEASMNGMTYDQYIRLLNNYDGRPLWCIPAGMEIHHKDGNHNNNSPENLEMLSKSDHAKLGIEQSLQNLNYKNTVLEVSSVVPAGEQVVYDVVCENDHNFVANGFFLHNCSKSTFATSMILDPAEKGVPIAYFALEDDPKDVVQRILIQCDMDEERAQKILKNIMFMPESDGYTLDAMAGAIEKIFSVADIVVVDPLQMIFESSVEERGETEFNRQRLFMRKMNNVMKHTNKTLIIVSHTAKKGGKNDAKTGVDRIIGSSAVAQVSTKCIEIDRKEDGLHGIRMWKSRFTPYRFCGLQIRLNNMKIRTVYSPDDLPQARMNWEGKVK